MTDSLDAIDRYRTVRIWFSMGDRRRVQSVRTRRPGAAERRDVSLAAIVGPFIGVLVMVALVRVEAATRSRPLPRSGDDLRVADSD